MADNVVYKIVVKTSSTWTGAETNATVSFNLIGENGEKSTGFFMVDNFWANDFERGQVDEFEITAKNVGLPVVVGIKLTHGYSGKDAWFCDYIKIEVDGHKALYPVYDWIEDELSVTRGKATLPQHSSSFLRQMRQTEVDRHKRDYEWMPNITKDDLGWGMPRSLNIATYDDLPAIFKREELLQEHLDQKKIERGTDIILNIIKSIVYPISKLEDYHGLNRREFSDRQATNYTVDWDTDEGMGRQVLTGINPLAVSQCYKLPSYFNVINADVRQSLGPNTTLEKELEAGNCYIIDFKEKIEEYKRNFYWDTDILLHVPNALGLFHINSKGSFLPIAIQLVPGDRDYLFTPADTKDDWLLAKMYFRSAECNLHEWDGHLFSTHIIMEPYCIALFRCLPRCHPIYKLLKPHLQTVVAVNAEGRTTLIVPGSPANRAIGTVSADALRVLFKRHTFDDLDVMKRLKTQGLLNPSISNFYYRDDAVLLWDIIKRYVSKMIRHFYKSDQDVCNDYELQDYANDLATNGLGWQDGNTRGIPNKITTIEQLVDICQVVIYTSSVQHAAVNFGQYETYRFAPNCPSAMRLPPHKKGEATMERIMQSLPDAKVALGTIALSYTLSSFPEGESYLGEYREHLMTELEIHRIREDYRSELREAGEKMRKRNEGLQHPYTWLYPNRVPNSISI
ncbi:unnamed protein product [Clavelina lepadiformis]|uniref:Uncharacterized protein n=1 Tax=Clavelina lepadiformis TaxID=159417 RepID=A0ABP0GVB3_CLALP